MACKAEDICQAGMIKLQHLGYAAQYIVVVHCSLVYRVCGVISARIKSTCYSSVNIFSGVGTAAAYGRNGRQNMALPYGLGYFSAFS